MTDLRLITNQQVKILLESQRIPVVLVNVRGKCVCGLLMEGHGTEPIGTEKALSCKCGRVYSVSEEGDAIVATLINHITLKS
jgi:hypothetical protein